MTDTLTQGQKLAPGESLVSNNGAHTLTLQDDGNLVLASSGSPLWSTSTNGKGVERAELQADGNFVLYAGDTAVWDSGTSGKQDTKLVLQDDRNLVLEAADGPVWATDTETGEAAAAAAASIEEELGVKAANSVEPESAPEPSPRTYTVESGDTLWAIAERFYGDGAKSQLIADASGVPNPDLIQPGQVLTIP